MQIKVFFITKIFTCVTLVNNSDSKMSELKNSNNKKELSEQFNYCPNNRTPSWISGLINDRSNNSFIT